MTIARGVQHRFLEPPGAPCSGQAFHADGAPAVLLARTDGRTAPDTGAVRESGWWVRGR